MLFRRIETNKLPANRKYLESSGFDTPFDEHSGLLNHRGKQQNENPFNHLFL